MSTVVWKLHQKSMNLQIIVFSNTNLYKISFIPCKYIGVKIKMEHSNLIQLIEKQIGVEQENVRSVSETEKKVGIAAARLFLLEIRLDSQKHAGILKGILEVLSSVPSSQTLWEHRLESYIDPLVVKKELNSHMEREAEMIKHVEKEIAKTKDEGLKLLLQHIIEDEKKHHKILETIVKHMYKMNP